MVGRGVAVARRCRPPRQKGSHGDQGHLDILNSERDQSATPTGPSASRIARAAGRWLAKLPTNPMCRRCSTHEKWNGLKRREISTTRHTLKKRRLPQRDGGLALCRLPPR